MENKVVKCVFCGNRHAIYSLKVVGFICYIQYTLNNQSTVSLSSQLDTDLSKNRTPKRQLYIDDTADTSIIRPQSENSSALSPKNYKANLKTQIITK